MGSDEKNYRLDRFVNAQSRVYQQVIKELKSGKKTSHWMWFIFPQIAGLGHSATAREFAISGRDEAVSYLDHPLLGLRLRECSRLVLSIENRSIEEIFGYPDNLKFHSSMTLFDQVAAGTGDFAATLNKYFAGRRDQATLELLD